MNRPLRISTDVRAIKPKMMLSVRMTKPQE
jgi:hypothetical protein